jgi:methylmalonyl-CoA mutase
MPNQASPKETSLFAEFDRPTYEEWVAATVKSLKGKSFERLTQNSDEGIPIKPLYTQADTADLTHPNTIPGRIPFVRGTEADGYLIRPWLVAQELAYPTAEQFNRALRYDLERGQTAVNLRLDPPTRAGLDPDQSKPGEVGWRGVSLATIEDMATALSGVDLARLPIFMRVGTAALPLLALLAAYLRRNGKDVSQLQGCLENDPLGVLTHEGTLPLSINQAYDEMARLLLWAAKRAPRLRTIGLHSYPCHNSGANAVQELAFTLGNGAAYLRAMGERGLDVNVTARHMMFHFAVSGDFFMEIAKLRAARILWSQIVAAFGGDVAAQKMRLHVRTAVINKTVTDPYVNMLRVTTEALSAALGGADSISVAPFDEMIRPPDEFSRRIARNVQIILQEEAYLTHLLDPSGGAYYIEYLTDELARRAWTLFQEVEGRGGMLAALQTDFPQELIAKEVKSQTDKLAARKDVLVGTNLYANAEETLLENTAVDFTAVYRQRTQQIENYRTHDDDPTAHTAVLQMLNRMLTAPPEEMVEAAIAAAQAGATLNEITRTLRINDEERPSIQPVTLHRRAEPFEELRHLAEAYEERYGRRPHIFLANMGPLRQFKARADFARSFFEPGGFEIIYPKGFEDVATAVTAAQEAKLAAVIICSTDEVYPEVVPTLARALKEEMGKDTAVLLAGRPGEREDLYRTAGVDEFIYLGANCYEVNNWLLASILDADTS